MKNSVHVSKLLIALSLLCGQVVAATDTNMRHNNTSACCPKEEKKHPQKQQCKSYRNITAHEINQASRHSTHGLVLDHPGYYKVCENVNWKVKTPTSFAITIAADNVILDLDGHFIKQRDITKAGNFPIQIAPGVQCVQILNGSLEYGSGGAILVQAGTQDILIDQIACKKCSYNGSTPIEPLFGGLISEVGAAILVNGTVANGINSVTITNCRFNDVGILGDEPVSFLGSISGTTLTTAAAPLAPLAPGFELFGAGVTPGTVIVSGSGTSYTVSPSQNVAGPEPMTVSDPNGMFIPFGFICSVFVYNSTNVTVHACAMEGNFGEFASFPLTSIQCSTVLTSKNSIRNIRTFGLAKGISAIFNNDVIIEDTKIDTMVMNVTPSAQSPMGHGVEGTKLTGCTNVTLRRVSWNNLTIQTQVPVTFIDPTAYFDCVGFIADFATPFNNYWIENCFASNMKSDGGQVSSNPAYTGGFNHHVIPTSIDDIQFVDCTASNIQGSVGWAFGFGGAPAPSNFSANDVTYSNCTVENVTIAAGPDFAGKYAAGFIVNGTNHQVNSCKVNRISDRRGLPTSAAYGIILDTKASEEATNCIVSNNRITHCDTSCIFDTTVAKNSVITGNYAALSGPAGAGPNYVDLNIYVPIVIWKPYLSSVAPATPSSLDNISIEN